MKACLPSNQCTVPENTKLLLLDVPDYFTFGRKATLGMNPKQIPDLHWQLADTYHTTNIGQSTLHMSTPSVDVHILSFAGKRIYSNTCGTNLFINTITIDSNIDTIICSSSNKA